MLSVAKSLLVAGKSETLRCAQGDREDEGFTREGMLLPDFFHPRL